MGTIHPRIRTALLLPIVQAIGATSLFLSGIDAINALLQFDAIDPVHLDVKQRSIPAAFR